MKRPTMGRPRAVVGKPAVDVQRVAQALSMPGIDPRMWLSSGTVGVRQDDGTFVTDDPQAVYADEFGAVVDVRLEPSEDIVTVRWNGISCGRYGQMLFPLRSGDEVVVAFPNGSANAAGAYIAAMQSNATAQIPTDWNNDRVLFNFSVPLEIRAPALDIGGANVRIQGRPVSRSSEPL